MRAPIAEHGVKDVRAEPPEYGTTPALGNTDGHTNALLPQYFPKGTDLSLHTPEELAAVALKLNQRPRERLG